MANLLLTYSQQQQIKPISKNNVDRYNLIAREVEDVELKKLLGIKFLTDIQTNPSNYTNILDEKSFEDADGNSIQHKGLRYVIAYFNYSKYVGESDIEDTFTGMVTKNRNESESLSEGRIRRLQEQYRQIALTAWDTIKYYLDLNGDDYELWDSTLIKKVFRPKIFGLKKTSYGG